MSEMELDEIKIYKSTCIRKSEETIVFGKEDAETAFIFHGNIEGYEKTPLVNLPNLASKCKVGYIYVKDESKRFNLNSFKGLGGSYAMFRILCEELGLEHDKAHLKDLFTDNNKKGIERMEFVTCTDGNHGRGISWAAGLFGCKAHVYMPHGSEEVRAEAIRKAGPAEVEITNLNYDDTVKYALEMSKKHGWILIQDTAWDDYEKIPIWIIQGYLTMAYEISKEFDELQRTPTHIFLQAGVGAMAGGMVSFFTEYYRNNKPVFAIVEPSVSDCIYRSAKAGDGKLRSVDGSPATIMAGLNCGTPCKIIWPAIWNNVNYYIAITDEIAKEGMRTYAAGDLNDPIIISGESGAATLGALEKILTDPCFTKMRIDMGFNEQSVILLINTEGDTDPDNYKKIVSEC